MDAPVGADLESSPPIPDPYCLGTNGYEEFRKQLRTNPLPAWRDRIPVVFWRLNDRKQRHHAGQLAMQPALSAVL